MDTCWCPDADRRLWPVAVACGPVRWVGRKRKRRSVGRDARDAQIPNKQMWHHEEVVILRHVDQLRGSMQLKTRQPQGSRNACVVYLISVGFPRPYVIIYDGTNIVPPPLIPFGQLNTPVRTLPTTKAVPNHSTWADLLRLLLWLSSSVYGSVSHLYSLLKEAGTTYASFPSSIPSC